MAEDALGSALEQGGINPLGDIAVEIPASDRVELEKIVISDEILIASALIVQKMQEFPAVPNNPPYEYKLDESRLATGFTKDGRVGLSYERKIDRIFPKEEEGGGIRDTVAQADLVIRNEDGKGDVVLSQKVGETPRLSVHDKDGVVFFEFTPDSSKGKPELKWRQTKILGNPSKNRGKNALVYAVNLLNGIFVSSLKPEPAEVDKQEPKSEDPAA